MSDDRGEGRLREAAERYRQWGRWGEDDQVGTVNLVTPKAIVAAAGLVRRGKVFSLALPFDQSGPQKGYLRRFNPMLFMLRDGDDAVARDMLGVPRGMGAADDVVIMATQGGTQWDALGHMFYDGKMWNGYDATLVSSLGAEKNDVAQYRDRIVGRAVLLDIPRFLGKPWCEPGRATSGEELDACAIAQGVEIRPGDFVLIRFGQIAQCREAGSWGDYAGGDAPGLAFDTLEWIRAHDIAGLATDTWGAEVRPNEIAYVAQPWHRVALPSMGLLVGEMFDLDELAADSAEDRVYESFFVACPLPITGAVGSPVNPIAIK
ncbi:MAG TPA: cyclase family protein [Candidatus Limnocylindrales bacterium]|nr:cyclase family protein [Candidatus Limnocylindrales bacterium]